MFFTIMCKGIVKRLIKAQLWIWL